MTWLPGILALLLGSMTLFGWAFDFPVLTRISDDWKPMVPSTALCFVLGGLSLLADKASTHRRASATQSILVWLILGMAGARAIELLFSPGFGIDFLLPDWIARYSGSGHMSPQTMTGFLAFSIGMLAVRQAGSHPARLFAGTMAAALMIMGVGALLGYWLDFQLVFESFYSRTGLMWMSFPTAVGMALLGLGLQCLLLKCGQDSAAGSVDQQAARIYRTSLFVLTATAVATGLAGMSFLQQTVFNQTNTDLTHSLDALRSHIHTSLDHSIQRAEVAGLTPALNAAAIRSIRSPDRASASTRSSRIAEELLVHGFTGIGVESGNRRLQLSGHMLPDTTRFSRFDGETDVALAWDDGYYLRVRVPVRNASRAPTSSFLVFEQRLTHMDRIFDEANHWGTTGALPMCIRLDLAKLLCYPQREQAAVYVTQDTYEGKPIPMAYALAGKSGIDTMTDYRGHRVLAAYGPVARTGLGLVLRKDLTEIYSPIRKELLIALPLIVFMVALGLWVIRLRIKPLVKDMARAHAAESTARARFDASIQSSPDGFVIYESVKNPAGEIIDFRYVYANRQAEEIFGYARDDLLGHSLLELLPEQRPVFAKYLNIALTSEPLFEAFSPANGKWYMRQAVAMPEGVAVTFRDITIEKNLIRELESSNRLRTAIVESAAYSIISTDVDGTILTFNQAAEHMLWYRADEVVGKTTPTLFHDAEEVIERAASLSHELGYTVEPGFDVFVAKAKMNAQEEREWTYVRKDGSRFPIRLSVTTLRDEHDVLQGFLGIAYDISEQKRAEEYIRHIALHDVLTGLPNRALLDDRVTMAIEQQHRHNTPFALAMMDIDRFKHINDSMGHHIGDSLLKEFVDRLKSCLRPTDTLARMGGDEFVLLLPDTDETGAKGVIERIQHEMTPPINVGMQEVHISSSLGISMFPRDGQNLQELLRCADVAMYWVKEHGRNGYKMFSRDMDSGGANRLGLERDLHLALDSGGFSLFYQPKVDLRTNTLYGFEALLRLHRANGQLISPADFIPLTEETGLIIPIGKWVLETACRDAIRMQQMLGVPLKIAVNISPRQFMNGNLVDTVQRALGQAHLDAGKLELEITENVLMDDNPGVAEALRELHELGVKIAIDDFGTGYSSLSYLKRYPIDKLKIDQSFVRDMTSDSGDATLVTAIIAMGHSLNIPVIAEGIETDEQLAMLRANGCDMGQGFHIGRPMPLDELLQWFSNTTRWKPGTPPNLIDTV